MIFYFFVRHEKNDDDEKVTKKKKKILIHVYMCSLHRPFHIHTYTVLYYYLISRIPVSPHTSITIINLLSTSSK